MNQDFVAIALTPSDWYYIFLASATEPAASPPDLQAPYGWVSGSFVIANPSPKGTLLKVRGKQLLGEKDPIIEILLRGTYSNEPWSVTWLVIPILAGIGSRHVEPEIRELKP